MVNKKFIEVYVSCFFVNDLLVQPHASASSLHMQTMRFASATATGQIAAVDLESPYAVDVGPDMIEIVMALFNLLSAEPVRR